MRRLFFVSTSFLAGCLALSAASDSDQSGGRPIPPGVREADKQTNAPIEPPPKFAQKPADTATLKKEAEELSKLSSAVLSAIDRVGQGQVPKDLNEQLKRIEKLAKHIRSEVSP